MLIVVFHCDFILRSGHLVNHGWLSVDVFFVLSGFVIALRYEAKLRRKGGFAAFLNARAVRLLPVHMLGTIAVTAVIFAGLARGHPVEAFAPTLGLAMAFGLLLIPNSRFVPDHIFSSPEAFPLNPPLWSLFDEWVANILYGLALHRLRTWQVAALVAICWAGLLLYEWHTQLYWGAGNHVGQIFIGIVRATSEFLAGVVVFRLYVAGRLSQVRPVRPELVYATCFLVASIPMGMPLIPAFITDFLPATFGSSAAVALLAASGRPAPRIFVWLGAISYPLYASHWAVLELAAIWLKDTERHSAMWAIPIVAVALGLAWAIGRVAELIIRRARYSSGSPRLATTP